MSDYFELVSSRESCRNYNPDRRPTREQLVKCIQTAQLAPSACNSQPWSYIVVNDPEKSPLVAAATQTAGLNKFTNKCPAFVIVCEEDAYLIGRQGAEPEIRPHRRRPVGLSAVLRCHPAGTFHLHHGLLRPEDAAGKPGHRRAQAGAAGGRGRLRRHRRPAPQKAQTARRGDDLHWIRISSRPRWSPP